MQTRYTARDFAGKGDQKLIGNKAIIGVDDEVYDMEGSGTFTGADSTIRVYTGVASVVRDISRLC